GGADKSLGVKGLVCLATPFLVARPRDLGGYGMGGIAMMVMVLSWIVYHWHYRHLTPSQLSLKQWAVFLVAASLLIVVLEKLWSVKAAQFVGDMRLPEMSQLPVLNIRACGDEASAGLSFTWSLGFLFG